MLFLKVHIALLVPFYRSFFFSSPAYILSKTGFIRKLPSCPENISECKAQKYISEHFPILLSHPESCGTKLWLFLLWAFGKMLFYNSFIRQPSSLQLSQILIPHWHCLQMSLSLLLGQIIVSDYTWSPFFIIWVMWLSMRPGERRGRTQWMQKVDGRRHVNGGAHSTTMPLWGAFYNLSQSGLGGQVEQTGSAESSHLSDWTALPIPVTGWVMRAKCFNFLRFSFLVYRVKTVTPISQSLHGVWTT